jgi:hypothetical protein
MKKPFHPGYDPPTGHFLPLKAGEKPPKMLKMEQELQVKFEDDYENLVLSGKMGQLLFARRWNVAKNQIFLTSPNARRRSWIQILKLPKYNLRNASAQPEAPSERPACEACGARNVPLEKAHWLEHRNGGPYQSWNLAKLCRNCHTNLDRGEASTTEIVRRELLARVVRKMVEAEGDSPKFKEELLERCHTILFSRRP